MPASPKRSSSACVKYGLALGRISIAWRSLRFSAPGLQPVALVGEPGPGAAVTLRPANHRRSVSAVYPTFSAIGRMVAHCGPCSAS